MKLTVYFIRHGESCANVVQNYFGCFHVCLRDPDLTDLGKFNSSQIDLPAVDFVCCSTLLRAKQTARICCPNRQIYVLPGIQELGYGLDNTPYDCIEQFDDFTDIANFIHLPNDSTSKDFLSYLENHLLKDKTSNFSIALFTHQRFIAKHTDVKKAANNEIVTKIYEL